MPLSERQLKYLKSRKFLVKWLRILVTKIQEGKYLKIIDVLRDDPN